MSKNDELGFIVPLIVGAAVVWFFVKDSDWVARMYATNRYNLPNSKISFEGSRAYDCDFMTAPLGAKRCSYKRDYLAEWFSLSSTSQPISYGGLQEDPPTACSHEDLDFVHKCYNTEIQPDEHPTREWKARSVHVYWRKVDK